MDGIQIYYSALLVFSLFSYSVLILSTKDAKALAKKIVELMFFTLLTLPIVGRVFLWW